MAGLPKTDSFLVAVATPVSRDFRPDAAALSKRCATLMLQGCDGVALFGTTGEGPEFALDDRIASLDAVLADGIEPERVIVSVTALALPEIVCLARHALDRGVAGILLMPPCVYRGGITEEGAFRFFATVLDRLEQSDSRLYLYHFPDICGVPIGYRVVRRLEEAYPGAIAGVKDSGGDFDFTEGLLRRFAHLSIYTGTEVHVPQAMARGARGTVCGLGNVMPRLMRRMFDLPTEFERRRLAQLLIAADGVLSRAPFIAAIKAVLADATGEETWNRVVPPMAPVPLRERQWIVDDFRRWETSLPADLRSLYPDAEAVDPKIVALRR